MCLVLRFEEGNSFSGVGVCCCVQAIQSPKLEESIYSELIVK